MKYFQTKARNFPTQAQSFEQPKKVLCYTIYPEIFRSLKVCYPEKYAFISLCPTVPPQIGPTTMYVRLPHNVTCHQVTSLSWLV